MQLDFDKNKIIVVVVGVVFVILSLIGIYFVFFYSSSDNTLVDNTLTNNEQVQTGENGGLPTIGTTGNNGSDVKTAEQENQSPDKSVAAVVGTDKITAKPYVEERVTALKVSAGAGARYYQPTTGMFYKRLSNGQSVPLSDRQFNGVEKVTWSSKDKAVIEYPDGANIVYDFVKQEQYTLPAQLKDFAFNQQADTLVAKVTGPLLEDNWLVTIGADGSNLSYIESMGDNGDKVQTIWAPNGMVAAMLADSNGSDSNTIVPIGLHGENYSSFNTVGRGFKGVWTDNGKKMLFTTYSSQIDFRNTLWLAEFNEDLSVRRQINLGLNTYLSKCDVGNEKAYCAVPQNMPAGGGWFPELTKDIADDIYVIDFKTLDVRKIATPIIDNAGVTASSVQYDQQSGQLLLSDEKTGQIFSIKLTD